MGWQLLVGTVVTFWYQWQGKFTALSPVVEPGGSRHTIDPHTTSLYTGLNPHALKEFPMKIEIGAYEAKTKLPELLRGVQAGKRYTITLRGRAVADLVPVQGAGRPAAAEAVAQMKRFMSCTPVKGVDIKALIEEGRA